MLRACCEAALLWIYIKFANLNIIKKANHVKPAAYNGYMHCCFKRIIFYLLILGKFWLLPLHVQSLVISCAWEVWDEFQCHNKTLCFRTLSMKDVELQLMAFGEQISVGALYTTLKHYFQFGTFVASQYAVMLGNLQSSDRFCPCILECNWHQKQFSVLWEGNLELLILLIFWNKIFERIALINKKHTSAPNGTKHVELFCTYFPAQKSYQE